MAEMSFAEDAPVYDLDTQSPQLENQADSTVTAIPQPNYAPSESLNLEQRVSRAEQQINHIQEKEASSKINTLQTELQALRGKLEELNHQLEQLQSQIRSQYADLDKRINESARADTAVSPPENTLASSEDSSPLTKPTKVKKIIATKEITKTKTKPETVNTDQPNVAEEQQIYQTAYDLIKAKKYNEAVNALQKMLHKYPTGQFAANAHYWLGELYGLLGKNEESANQFGEVINKYPDSPKVSDAQLKLGLIQLAQFKWAEAKQVFKKVINRYPGTASARLAAQQLKQIREAGH